MHGNRELISQALANLVDNAIKYAAPNNATLAPEQSPLNGAQPEIVVKAAGEGDRILLTVADTGPGIPAARPLARGRALRAAGAEPVAAGLGAGARVSPMRSPACMAASCGWRTTRPACGRCWRCRAACPPLLPILSQHPRKGCRFPLSCDSGPAVTNSRDGGICNDGG